MNAETFLATHTRKARAPLAPEIALSLADGVIAVWEAVEAWQGRTGTEPPYWAFAWPGGQALARHVLDHPELVAGRRVLDFAAGCGIAAIASALAGAAAVEAAEIDPLAVAAITRNAAANGVALAVAGGDLVGSACRWDLVLCGDVCYQAPMAARILPWFAGLAKTAEVWIADPGRAYLPKTGLAAFARYEVPTSLELEDHASRATTLYRLLPDGAAGCGTEAARA